MTDTFVYPYPFWRVVENEYYPTLNTFSRNIGQLAEQGIIQLPNLRNCQNICIGSDYSGEQDHNEYQVLGFVIANRDTAHVWSKNIQAMRQHYRLANRIIAYKNLNSSAGHRLLVPFFEASDTLEGVCIVIAIHRTCQLFDQTPILGAWKNTNAFVKAVRIANLVSLFLGGLMKPNQNILWITDRDNIIANDEQGSDFVKMVDIVKTNYIPYPVQSIEIATTASNDPTTMELEDLTAIPDLIAGAVSHLYTHHYQINPNIFFQPSMKVSDEIRKKVKKIMQWVANNDAPLKKMIFALTPNPATNEISIQLMKYRVGRKP